MRKLNKFEKSLKEIQKEFYLKILSFLKENQVIIGDSFSIELMNYETFSSFLSGYDPKNKNSTILCDKRIFSSKMEMLKYYRKLYNLHIEFNENRITNLTKRYQKLFNIGEK